MADSWDECFSTRGHSSLFFDFLHKKQFSKEQKMGFSMKYQSVVDICASMKYNTFTIQVGAGVSPAG